MPIHSFTTTDELRSHLAALTGRDTWAPPAAYAVGIARLSTAADGTKVLDTYYPHVNHGENEGFLALLLDALGSRVATGTVELSGAVLARCTAELAVTRDDGGDHPNARALDALAAMVDAPVTTAAVRSVPVLTMIEDLSAAPVDAHDVYLRLHLISSRAVKPHGCNLDGQFGLLNNVVWTDRGPFDPDTFERDRLAIRASGGSITVLSIDKFPQMADYVIPSGVRITVPSRVRLGAYLGEGTTLMHEGFVNFNAGTEGPAMVEGRISAGVFVGASSDIGGGASIMGTLSGGGKEVISVGSGCLLGANSGLGISLGDNCVVEAGLYLTAGTVVTLPDGERCKASRLSGRSDMLFRRNSVTGAVEMLPQGAEWGGLNAALHAN